MRNRFPKMENSLPKMKNTISYLVYRIFQMDNCLPVIGNPISYLDISISQMFGRFLTKITLVLAPKADDSILIVEG